MKIYVSSHNMELAMQVSAQLTGHGHKVVSKWHQGDWGASSYEQNLKDIEECDVLVLMVSSKPTAGGKFFEAGYAFAKGKRVISYMGAENFYMNRMEMASDLNNLLEKLK